MPHPPPFVGLVDHRERRDNETLIHIMWRGMYDAYAEAISLYKLGLKDPHTVNSPGTAKARLWA